MVTGQGEATRDMARLPTLTHPVICVSQDFGQPMYLFNVMKGFVDTVGEAKHKNRRGWIG